MITKYCHFCHAPSHETNKCPIEISASNLLKKKIGIIMEYFVASNLKCPECNNPTLKVIGNCSPSLDIVCNYCNSIFEVKSKCLSNYFIPNDIVLPHGVYNKFIKRCDEGLNIIIVIYGIDRYNKNIVIREILYINNETLKDDNNIQLLQNKNNLLSTISIKNKLLLRPIILESINVISFADEFELLKTNLNI